MMDNPDWTWTDAFGDTLEVRRAGAELVLTVIRKGDGPEVDHACVSLDPEQQRGLRAALGVHLRRE